jgi:hypothetical protein
LEFGVFNRCPEFGIEAAVEIYVPMEKFFRNVA